MSGKYYDPNNYPAKSVNKITIYSNVITLSGSTTDGHTANITINGHLNYAIATVSGTSLTTTAAAWCAANYEFYKVRGWIVTSSGAVITVSPAHSWDTVNRINATIENVSGTLTGTASGNFVLDGSKSKVWEVTFTTATAVAAAPVNLKDYENVVVVFKTTANTVVTISALLDLGTESTISMTTGVLYYFDGLYNLTAGLLISPTVDIVTALLADGSVTSDKLADTLDLTDKTVAFSPQEGTPVNAVAAAGLLTLIGTVADGETIIVGDETFEIDTDGSVGPGSIAIDVSSFATASQATLTVTGGGTQIANNDTVTIDDGGANEKVYTFKTTLTPTEGEVLIGVSDTAALLNLLNAINHTGTPGTDYSCAAAHPTVEGTSSDATTLIVSAITPGAAGDSITTAETGAELSWDGNLGTTTPGVDCSAANADGAIVTDASAGSALVVATQGSGTTVIFTALVAGVAGNDISFATDLVNGAVDDTVLGTEVEGIDGTVGAKNEMLVDATNLYIASDVNTIADANWKKLVLQSL